ncbi:NDR1/HIN1-like protein 13 [Ananas comosus]|uniref:NDR1/HIN1-like protein 13 n=1 Tax=Ananas comosus TaxID=4615 RepID=A0A6P5G2J7_ANACO|nr:NDR1/HIN1-like protein 13 [Ananas comosus]
MADRVHPDDHLNSFPEKPKPEPEREPEPETETETDRAEYLPSFAEKPKPPPGTYLIQIPKDQVFRVPPPENASKLAAYTRLAAAAAALYFALRPKLPSFSLASLAINGLAPSSSSSSSPISPDLAAAIRARNPNSKIGLRYLPGGSVAASYGAVALANGAWPAFFQGRDNVTEFVTPLAGSGIRLSPSTRASMVTAQRNGAVPLTVDARLPVRAKVGAVTTWTWTVKVRCDVTVDELTANATIISQACHVKLRL